MRYPAAGVIIKVLSVSLRNITVPVGLIAPFGPAVAVMVTLGLGAKEDADRVRGSHVEMV